MYRLSWVVGAFATSFLACIGSLMGFWGVQRKSWVILNYYRVIKALQLILVIASSVIVLMNLSDIAPSLADEIIQEIDEAAQEAGEPIPIIDRKKLIEKVTMGLIASSIGSIMLWITFGLYALYIIHSLYTWYKRGSDPTMQSFFVSLPPPEMGGQSGVAPQIQYATPLLQGQSPSIPLSVA